ncbi:MAG: transporter substrate-binding domain-containing protein [Algoriphagus sp.]|jgi:membrane-bound lytic murein transglycosylase F|nr:transporter substrate-binding domain-containing protein [Algoriphagus sp.]MCE2778983.1 transporter substrate-binding domain-containing protein [Algoriphagus sp.]
MEKKKVILLVVVVGIFLGIGAIGYLNNWFNKSSASEFILDKEGVQARGTLRVAVDNNSSSYYIYRGRRMGFEYELLLDLGKRLGVQVEFIVAADIDDAFAQLKDGRVDLIAMNLQQNTGTNVSYTEAIGSMSTVLVGREKLLSWDSLGKDTVVVRKGAVYTSQLLRLKDSLDLDFSILEVPDHEETLLDRLVEKEINWTVAEKTVAQTNATYYDDLRLGLDVSKEGTVTWAMRNTSTDLLQVVNTWLLEKKKRLIPDLYTKYFLNSKNQHFRTTSTYSSLGGNRISVYDELIQENAKTLGWDWRLLAAVVYKESAFDTTALSYAGAQGLLQLMPVTLERFGVTNPSDPAESLRGGVKYLQYLDKFWLERVPETNERIKFILASYNIGQGHVEDAWKLTLKYRKNTQSWQEVSNFLNLKSDPKYYRDPVVKSGYAKGHIAVNYVRDVLGLFQSYKALVDP